VDRPHACPHCQSLHTVPTLKTPAHQFYLCLTCRSAWGVLDVVTMIEPDGGDAGGETDS
jgi:hypothetical protein